MQGRRGKPALILALAALVAWMPGAFGEHERDGSARAAPKQAGAAANDAQRAAAETVARAEAALRGLSGEQLAAPFGGTPPAWAREWVRGRGKDDLFNRQWKAAAVHLPRPYHGAEWLGVFSMYHPVEADADHFHRLERQGNVWVLGAEIDEREPGAEYRITHHELQARVTPAEHRLEATDRMTVRRLAGARGLMLARMNDDYEVADVQAAGAPAPFVRAGGLLAIALPIGTTADLSVLVKYSGVVHHEGLDNIDPEVSFLFSYWYPNVARLPATGDLTVTAPAAWTTIAQGEQESRVEVDGEARTRWRQMHPVCWLQFASGPYHHTSRSVEGKTLNVYLLGADSKTAEAALDSVAKALPWYSRTFAPFPWSHYDVVEYPMVLGALEGYSFTTASLDLIPKALSHELAHSWWGGLVPNTYTVDMWNEAFATYSERLLSEAAGTRPLPGRQPGEDRPRGRRFPSEVPIIGAADALVHAHSVIGYHKGAAVLHMFRRTVGDDPFYKALTRFARQRAGQASTWRDFQRAAQAALGKEMAWFFDPWLTRTDAPRLRWLSARQQRGTLEAEIELTNPAYRLRLPIAIDTADGKRLIEWVDVAGRHTRFHRPLTVRALRLVMDPSADFVLEPAEQRPRPWTLELAPETTDRRPPAAEARRARQSLLRGCLPSCGARKPPTVPHSSEQEAANPPSQLLPISANTRRASSVPSRIPSRGRDRPQTPGA